MSAQPDPDALIADGWHDDDDSFDSDPYCSVCGGYMEWVDCWSCGGEGERDVYEEDPMWYDPGDTEKCTECNGAGGYWQCASLPHKEKVK